MINFDNMYVVGYNIIKGVHVWIYITLNQQSIMILYTILEIYERDKDASYSWICP